MPLVRIELQQGKDFEYRQQVSQIVHHAMVS